MGIQLQSSTIASEVLPIMPQLPFNVGQLRIEFILLFYCLCSIKISVSHAVCIYAYAYLRMWFSTTKKSMDVHHPHSEVVGKPSIQISHAHA